MFVNCSYCGKKLWRKPYLVKKWNHHFCDSGCKKKYITKDIIMNCDLCGKEFSTKPYRLKRNLKHYCSRKCSSKANIELYHKNRGLNYNYIEIEPELLWALYWGNQYSSIKISNLLYCGASTICRKMRLYDIPKRESGEIIRDGDSWIKGKKHSEKSKKKMSEAKNGMFLGNENPNWRGGVSFEPYGLEFNDSLKEKIRERDNHICQECGIHQDELGYKLHVHHIDYDKKNNSEENLIALCRNCHLQTNFSRDDWTKYFTKKINELEKEVFG